MNEIQLAFIKIFKKSRYQNNLLAIPADHFHNSRLNLPSE